MEIAIALLTLVKELTPLVLEAINADEQELEAIKHSALASINRLDVAVREIEDRRRQRYAEAESEIKGKRE